MWEGEADYFLNHSDEECKQIVSSEQTNVYSFCHMFYDLVPGCVGKAAWRSCQRNIRGGGGAEVANGPAFSWSICKIWSKPKERFSSKKLCYKLNNYTFQFLYYSLKQKALMDPVGNILFAGEYANKVNKHL